ncbi:MAG TPA: hypothetical protein VKG26_10135 [Bacteroidia bacterium]|nr:hypothetical protein [Bacteroidia bacterium]
MKKLNLFFGTALASAFLLSSCGPTKTTESSPTTTDTTTVPYTIKVDEIVVPGLPDLHSYTHAIYEDKIVMFGGRTSGLHTINYFFQKTRSNDSIYVVDTKQWKDPENWVVQAIQYKEIASFLSSKSKIDLRFFRANNAEFFTKNNMLYVFGGLHGDRDSTPTTLPYLSAIDLKSLVMAVNMLTTKAPDFHLLPPSWIRQIKDTSFALTGAEIDVMDNKVYLAFGWNYTGTTPGNAVDFYSHQVKSFTLSDDGKNMRVGPITSWNDGHANGADSVNEGIYRRRDGSMSPMIDPADNSDMLLYYAGVFKGGIINYTSPVWINQSGAKEIDFTMRSNIYTCQVIPVYSKNRKESYATLLGGMKNAAFIKIANQQFPVKLTDSTAPIIDTAGRVNNFSFAPFTNQFTTIRIDSLHNFTQYLLADSFPATATAYKFPGSDSDPNLKDTTINKGTAMFNGAESEMHWNLNKKYLMNNGVINYDVLMADSVNGASIGYLHGGILSLFPNVLNTNSFHYSVASNRLFKVRIVPLKK